MSIVLLVVFAALLGYAVALLESILKKLDEVKVEIGAVKADVKKIDEVKAEIGEVKAQAREDRNANAADHNRLFEKVSVLETHVGVLRDRSDRSGTES